MHVYVVEPGVVAVQRSRKYSVDLLGAMAVLEGKYVVGCLGIGSWLQHEM